MSGINFAAFDFGAESGRAVIGSFENEKLTLKEIHRFPNKQLNIDDHFHWDLPYLFNEIKTGLSKIVNAGIEIQGIGIDTWGVDFGLLDSHGNLIENPYAYRDSRTNGVMEKVFQKISKRDLYTRTGNQFLEFNSLFQLYSMDNNSSIKKADKLLFMPDLFNYMLCGEKFCEYTIASTSQMLDVKSRKWDSELLESLGLPSKILSTLVEPGVVIGSLTLEIQQDINISPIDVITVGAHDTASAVAAIPLRGQNCAYISSGTWSLLGIESSQPIISDQSFKYGFTNEGGVNKDYRFLKNTMGLWLLQRCRKKWSQQGNNFEYAELVQMADQAEPFYSVIDPDDASFLNPVDMPEAISKFCADTGQSIPKNPAQFTRIILESLAFKYRYVIDKINEMSENPINELHIVG
ncbi:MAG: rhamnulokinase, partial [Calditrichaceae bacterium]